MSRAEAVIDETSGGRGQSRTRTVSGPAQRSPLAIVYLTVFIDLLGFSIILPLLPFYAKHFGAGGVWVGALLTAYSAAQFVSAPYLGRLSDRVGRRPVLLFSLAGSAISLACTGLANSLLMLLMCRTFAGLCGGSIGAAQAYIADVTRPEDRTRYMGMLGASVGAGFVFGPAIGAALSPFGFGAAAFAAAALAAANFTMAWFRLPESRTSGRTPSVRGQLSLADVAGVARRPAIARLLGALFFSTFALASFEATYALFGSREFGLDDRGFALLFTYIGLLIVAVQGGLLRRLHGRYRERSLALGGSMLMGGALLAVPLARSVSPALLMLTLFALGQGLTSPTLASLLSGAAGADDQGRTLGLGQSATAAARAIGPLIGGWLFDLGVALPYIAAGMFALVAMCLVQAQTAHLKLSVTKDLAEKRVVGYYPTTRVADSGSSPTRFTQN